MSRKLGRQFSSWSLLPSILVDVKYVLGVDLDGVCADYNAGFREVVAAYRGIDAAELPKNRSWGFKEWGLSEADFDRLHQRAVTEDHMLATLPVIEGCADVLWRLSDAGVWIRIITHRLYKNWGHAAAVTDTVSWLDDAKIPYRDICFLGAKPEVEADLYIDDAPHNILALREAGNEVIVFDQSYNQDLPAPRAETWADVEEIALNHVSQKSAIQPQFPGFDAGADRLDHNTNRTGSAESKTP